jgi:hypothetical protein
MARCSKWLNYAVYPPDFHKTGFCWTFRRVTKARSKAKSLGIGSWIRRYVNVSESKFHIDRFWLWNGVRFVRVQEEPPFYRHPGLDLVLDELDSVRVPKSDPISPVLNRKREEARRVRSTACLLRRAPRLPSRVRENARPIKR